MTSISEDSLKERLQELQKQLGKKQMFEAAVSSIKSLLIETYPSASPSLRNSIYSVVCRVATILQSRYTAPGFWLAGLQLFEAAEGFITESSERENLKSYISRARGHLHDIDDQSEVPQSVQNSIHRDSGYLFEGHLTVDPEPPQPAWLRAQNVIAAAESSMRQSENGNAPESATEVLQDLINHMQQNLQDFESVIESALLDIDTVHHPRAPPASKEVVAKLPVITITEEILAKLGNETKCAVCTDELVLNDEMQELPCKHLFHPPCLKPWLDEHNSCPICRHELQTDDHGYESWKEREKEAEEERKGAANAVRGGEYMYV
ncbi:E3 ubiquitin-protein ligase AIP2 [Macadamia integrifolia]|uniref:E3 ubiquitin-protein ligase AIP2 n=1 Tax=Macadamia integrifolia TaxID=60698 RepID=UPI001C4EC6D0|nr:E3 ubiquitin-protein ligase AIP2 [Macadamia integrifolia]